MLTSWKHGGDIIDTGSVNDSKDDTNHAGRTQDKAPMRTLRQMNKCGTSDGRVTSREPSMYELLGQ